MHDSFLSSDFFPANRQLASGDYLSEVLPGWGKVVTKAKLSPGSPLILILCSSAIRAVQLNRSSRTFIAAKIPVDYFTPTPTPIFAHAPVLSNLIYTKHAQ